MQISMDCKMTLIRSGLFTNLEYNITISLIRQVPELDHKLTSVQRDQLTLNNCIVAYHSQQPQVMIICNHKMEILEIVAKNNKS